jgi:hypothetical protein
MPTAPAVIDLVKNGEVDAARGIDFEMRRGEIFGFLGPTARASRRRSTCSARSVKPSGGGVAIWRFSRAE